MKRFGNYHNFLMQPLIQIIKPQNTKQSVILDFGTKGLYSKYVLTFSVVGAWFSLDKYKIFLILEIPLTWLCHRSPFILEPWFHVVR